MASPGLHAALLGGLVVSLAAGAVEKCPGEARYAPAHACDQPGLFKVCAKLLDRPGATDLQTWGAKNYFEWMKQQDPSPAVGMMQSQKGDHACVSVWTFGAVTQLAGCSNVHLNCAASDVTSMLSMYAGKGMDAVATCVRQRCATDLPAKPTVRVKLDTTQAPTTPAPASATSPALTTKSGAPPHTPHPLQTAPGALPPPKLHLLSAAATAPVAPNVPILPKFTPAPKTAPVASPKAAVAPQATAPAASLKVPVPPAATVPRASPKGPMSPQSGAHIAGLPGLWFTAEHPGISCNELCLSIPGSSWVFDAVSSRHAGNAAGRHFYPAKKNGAVWTSVECSSMDNDENWGATGATPNGAWKNPGCLVNCACKKTGAAAAQAAAEAAAMAAAPPAGLPAGPPAAAAVAGGVPKSASPGASVPPMSNLGAAASMKISGATEVGGAPQIAAPQIAPRLSPITAAPGMMPGSATPGPGMMPRSAMTPAPTSHKSNVILGVFFHLCFFLCCLACCIGVAIESCKKNPHDFNRFVDQNMHKLSPNMQRQAHKFRQEINRQAMQRQQNQQYGQHGYDQHGMQGQLGYDQHGLAGQYDHTYPQPGMHGQYDQHNAGYPQQNAHHRDGHGHRSDMELQGYGQDGSFHGNPVSGGLSGGGYGPAPPPDSWNYQQAGRSVSRENSPRRGNASSRGNSPNRHQQQSREQFRHDAYRNPNYE